MSFTRSLGLFVSIGVCAFTLARGAEPASPCGKDRVLFLTDSHGLGPFGEAMDRWLATLPDTELQSYELGGSSPPWWFRGTVSPHGNLFNNCRGADVPPRNRIRDRHIPAPFLPALIEEGARRYRRQIVIIEQGGNVPGRPEVYREWGSRMVETVMRHPDNLCIWIAPPKMRKVRAPYSEKVFTAIRNGIEDAAKALNLPEGGPAPCLLIDSRPFTEYPRQGGDGYHYPFTPEGQAVGRAWADEIIRRIQPLIQAPFGG